jgi:spore coat protein A
VDGTLPVIQHNGEEGVHPKVINVEEVTGPKGRVKLGPADGYVDNTPKDMVTALPETVTRIKATFDKPGRYVWHCHILSHEDHEMMRVLHVGPGA